MAMIDVKGGKTLGVVAPTMSELTSRQCTVEELQAALVQLIGIVNENAKTQQKMSADLNNKQDREWRATL